MLLIKVEDEKVRYLDFHFNRNIDDWEAARRYVDSSDRRYNHCTGLAPITVFVGGGPWAPSGHKHHHNILCDEQTIEELRRIAGKGWLSSDKLKRMRKTEERDMLLEHLYNGCRPACLRQDTHYYATHGSNFVKDFYDARQISEKIEKLRKRE